MFWQMEYITRRKQKLNRKLIFKRKDVSISIKSGAILEMTGLIQVILRNLENMATDFIKSKMLSIIGCTIILSATKKEKTNKTMT